MSPEYLNLQISPSWKRVLEQQLSSPEYAKLLQRVQAASEAHEVYPPTRLVYNAFNLTPLERVKVVIIGQDPYHEPQQAIGLAFAVSAGTPLPPSLRNIYKELQADLGIPIPATGDLTPWSDQGVLLLNTSLTVERGKASSHSRIGWQLITYAAVRAVSQHRRNVVFMLWGSHAQQLRELIDEERHLVLMAAHPSPLSAHKGFFGCRHFSKANAYMQQQGIEPIDWSLNAHEAQTSMNL